MDELANIFSKDKAIQGNAFMALMRESDQAVSWVYDAWDLLVETLGHENNRVRAIAGQLLCNLAKSDCENRIFEAFPALLALTKDPRFVTARHCLQSLWKVAILSPDHQRMVMEGLSERFTGCEQEKNGTLIRLDIIVNFQKIHSFTSDPGLISVAEKLILSESDQKYRKKYLKVLRAMDQGL